MFRIQATYKTYNRHRHFRNRHDNSYIQTENSQACVNSFDDVSANLFRKRMRGNVREPFAMRDVVRCRDGTAVKVNRHSRQRQRHRQTCTTVKVPNHPRQRQRQTCTAVNARIVNNIHIIFYTQLHNHIGIIIICVCFTTDNMNCAATADECPSSSSTKTLVKMAKSAWCEGDVLTCEQ